MANLIIDNAISARYEDSTYSTILIEWKVEENDKEVIRTHSIPADPDNTDYRDLLEAGWTKEQIIKNTVEYKRRSSAAMNALIHKAAIELAQEISDKKIEREIERADRKIESEIKRIQSDADKKIKSVKELAQEVSDRKIKSAVKKIESVADKKIKSVKEQMEKTSIKDIDAIDYLTIIKSNKDKEALFQFKLWALELEEVKKADAEAKKTLRKQTTIIECLECLSDIMTKE